MTSCKVTSGRWLRRPCSTRRETARAVKIRRLTALCKGSVAVAFVFARLRTVCISASILQTRGTSEDEKSSFTPLNPRELEGGKSRAVVVPSISYLSISTASSSSHFAAKVGTGAGRYQHHLRHHRPSQRPQPFQQPQAQRFSCRQRLQILVRAGREWGAQAHQRMIATRRAWETPTNIVKKMRKRRRRRLRAGRVSAVA